MDLEGLMQVEVVTPAKRKMPLCQIPAAYTVLTEEDIKRSGATNIADALRSVPGMLVSRVDTDKWAVGVRGFSGIMTSKQLVLLDGRPLTSPVFSSVFWGNVGIPLDMIKRIEVVRGPWTSLWGADSFNGVINIITKTAEEMNGGTSVSLVTNEGFEQTVLYGGDIADSAQFSLHATAGYSEGLNTEDERNFRPKAEDWKRGSFGGRVDWENAYTDELSLQGSLARSDIRESIDILRKVSASNEHEAYNGYLQFVWDRATGIGSGVQFRTSYTRESNSLGSAANVYDGIDAEFLYAAEQHGAHLVTMGIGGRYSRDSFVEDPHMIFSEKDGYHFEANSYVQDRITLVDDHWFLTVGLKLDFFQTNALALQQTLRLLYTEDQEEYWLAVSRSTRQPNRMNRDASYNIHIHGKTYTLTLGNSLASEEQTSFEAGYRYQDRQGFEFDVSSYFNVYDNLIYLQYDDLTSTARYANALHGVSYGVETAAQWDALDWLSLRPSMNVVFQDFRNVQHSQLNGSPPIDDPLFDFKLQTLMQVSDSVQFDTIVSYMESLTDADVPKGLVLDARLGWQASDQLQVEFLANQLFMDLNSSGDIRNSPEVGMRLTWEF